MEQDNEHRLGLTDEEVAWLQSNMGKDETADRLIRQYQMVVVCPRDPGARGIFSAMLTDWRATKATS